MQRYKNASNDVEATAGCREKDVKSCGAFNLRPARDKLPQRWWFASTVIPLLAATTGPLSSVLSVASIATSWRLTLPDNGRLPAGADVQGIGIDDPTWEFVLNSCSLACGIIGNLFLLFNFTGRVRYIISLPLTVILWLMASALLIAATVALQVHLPPIAPGQIYSQGYWHAVFAAGLYLIDSTLLMINMLGYFLGRYPQQFELDDYQRTLILQTMMFFAWIAGGAGVISHLEGWSYADSIYWADVSILTIGFGDYAPMTVKGRIFHIFYEIMGIIFLGLVISSIAGFVGNVSADKIVKQHQRIVRNIVLERTVTSEAELYAHRGSNEASNPTKTSSSMLSVMPYRRGREAGPLLSRTVSFNSIPGLARAAPVFRNQRLVLLRKEEDRFHVMRQIQAKTRRFKDYGSLLMSLVAFLSLWMIGSAVFMYSERRLNQHSFFDSMHFSFVALLTIGYGDIAPQANLSKAFFVIWSIVAVPTMTVFIKNMSSTVAIAINKATLTMADWTVLSKKGVLRQFLARHPHIRTFLLGLSSSPRQQHTHQHEATEEFGDMVRETAEAALSRMEQQTSVNYHNPHHTNSHHKQHNVQHDHHHHHHHHHHHQFHCRHHHHTKSLLNAGPCDCSASVGEDSVPELARQLALVIRSVGNDLLQNPHKQYSYAEWVLFTKLIRFSSFIHGNGGARSPAAALDLVVAENKLEEEEGRHGLVEWDWLGEDSPMMHDGGEVAWAFERLCESMERYTKSVARYA